MFSQCILCRRPSSFSGVALGPVIDILLLCSATCTVLGCKGRPHPYRGAEDVSLVLDVQKTTRFPSCSPLIDVDVTCWAGPADSTCAVCVKTAEIPQLHASYSFLDKVVDMPVVFNDKCPYLSVQKTAKVPQLQRSFKVADVPVVQVVLVPQVLSAVVNVPVIIQRLVRVSSTAWCLRFSSPPESWTSCCTTETGTQLYQRRYGGCEWVFDAFCIIFRAPPVVPELSASFSSFRALTPVSARGLQRVCQFILW